MAENDENLKPKEGLNSNDENEKEKKENEIEE